MYSVWKYKNDNELIRIEKTWKTRQAAQYYKKKNEIDGMVLKNKNNNEQQLGIIEYIERKKREDK